ncbi:head GIN domain-containing protein [Cochleicola gelatinilyticus]|uniref:Putative auto-transporter adhesin head GIN domain-containing protein n=1 Tax=Cochleicola gelatinilyticus TaxID=1763537 RepID=A0A167GA88_9FLAO|nr:head GIN domain-containing protein [Cochleicola gelatinilyticus]OAB77378.1 hypothetical protein ULVI_12830 [Cochleicola gelatinilyticus]
MKTIKITLVVVLVALTTSCQFDINLGQENGNGNVITEERTVTSNFDEVKGSAGLDVLLTEGTENKIVVEADENLLEFIETEVTNGKLHVTSSRNIGHSKSKKVHVTYVKLSKVASSSGADVIVNSVLENDYLTFDASSGSNLQVEIFAKEVVAETSSGADLVLSGKAVNLQADASSGSELDAKDLFVVSCNAEASSGSDVTVHVKETLEVKATSGADINYYGEPKIIAQSDRSADRIRKMQ